MAAQRSADKMTRWDELLTAHVTPQLQPGERVVSVLSLASGPLHPLIPIIPFVGIVLMCTRWFRSYGLVLTDRRLLVVRRRKVGPTKYGQIDLAVPIEEATASWQARPSAGTLRIHAGGRTRKLYVVGTFTMAVPPFLAALSEEHRPRAGA